MVLGATIILALVASIASYGLLAITLAQGREAKFYRERSRAHGEAEAGIIWAQQNLITDPTWPGGGLDVDGDGIDDVTITVTPVCAGPPCPPQSMQAAVTYQVGIESEEED